MSHQPERIPPPLLFGAAAMVVASVVGVGVSQVANIGAQETSAPYVVESVTVLFRDEPDGGVGVYDFESGDTIKIFAPETGGFVRTAMRAVARTRKIEGAGPEAPFELARTAEGRLLLTDTLTGAMVSLEAFGDENAHEFAQLLSERSQDDA